MEHDYMNMKFEYIREEIGTTDPIEQLNILNALGAQRWRLVWIHTSANSPSAVLFFIRCVMDDGKTENKKPGYMDPRSMDHAD